MVLQQTLVLIKPDGVQRGLIGEIIKRFEQRGLKIVGLKLVHPDNDLAQQHYGKEIAERHGENARNSLIDYVTSSPVIAMVIQGIGAVSIVRKIVGSTFPAEADIGTIRGDFCHADKEYVRKENKGYNLVHASGNEEEAKKELALWFSIDEIHDYQRAEDKHII